MNLIGVVAVAAVIYVVWLLVRVAREHSTKTSLERAAKGPRRAVEELGTTGALDIGDTVVIDGIEGIEGIEGRVEGSLLLDCRGTQKPGTSSHATSGRYSGGAPTPVKQRLVHHRVVGNRDYWIGLGHGYSDEVLVLGDVGESATGSDAGLPADPAGATQLTVQGEEFALRRTLEGIATARGKTGLPRSALFTIHEYTGEDAVLLRRAVEGRDPDWFRGRALSAQQVEIRHSHDT